MNNTCAAARLMSVSSSLEDHEVVREIASKAGWAIDYAATLAEAKAHLAGNQVALILCAAELPDGSWRDLLGQIAGRAEPPLLIVTSRQADDYLWAEVLNLGGADVISKPFREQELRYMLKSASLRASAA